METSETIGKEIENDKKTQQLTKGKSKSLGKNII